MSHMPTAKMFVLLKNYFTGQINTQIVIITYFSDKCWGLVAKTYWRTVQLSIKLHANTMKNTETEKNVFK